MNDLKAIVFDVEHFATREGPGTPRGDTFFSFATENGCTGWRAALKAMPCRVGTAGVPRTWMLTLTRGVEERSFAVSDFASLSNVDDPDNWFSLWF